jgi:hypothetical protein
MERESFENDATAERMNAHCAQQARHLSDDQLAQCLSASVRASLGVSLKC